jgi:hypothetical protein
MCPLAAIPSVDYTAMRIPGIPCVNYQRSREARQIQKIRSVSETVDQVFTPIVEHGYEAAGCGNHVLLPHTVTTTCVSNAVHLHLFGDGRKVSEHSEMPKCTLFILGDGMEHRRPPVPTV